MMNNNLKNIQDLRNEIDSLDTHLITILSKRFIATREIGKLKQHDNLNAIDTNRLNSLCEKWINESNEQEVNPELALQILNTIHRFVVDEHKKTF